MKRLLQVVAVAALLQLPGFQVSLKAQPPMGDERYHRFGRGILDRVRGDLDRAERDLHYIPEPELRRFQSVRGNLGEFQRDWEHGRYDRGALDRVIGNLNMIVERGKLRPRDRDILFDDLGRLRDLRGRLDRGPR